MSESEQNRGFGGLATLVSDVSEDTDNVQFEQAPTAPSIPSANHGEAKEQERHGYDESNNTNVKKTLAVFGILFVAAVIAVLLFYSEYDSDNRSATTTPSTTLKSRTFASKSTTQQETPGMTRNIASTRATSPTTTRMTTPTYIEPPIGTSQTLSVPQICWCLREDIRLEAMRDVVDTFESVEKFNTLVEKYNDRCSSFRYRQGALETARRQVEAQRTQLGAEARTQAERWNKESSRDVLAPTPQVISSTKMVSEAQYLLNALGLNAGPVDGIMGPRTRNAILEFQRITDITETGRVDGQLLNLLRLVHDQVILN